MATTNPTVTPEPIVPEPSPTRDFTVAVFVIHGDRVLLHFHHKLNRWLPPGGHIEPNELPDEAAVREVMEETGVVCVLTGGTRMQYDDSSLPRQLITPAGIQLEQIGPAHQHIDLIYFATGEPAESREQVGWFRLDELDPLNLTLEVATWCRLAIESVPSSP
jgi:8-oxo-dGTP pyrophosphatase MutT (NUDIX family)